jgi:glycosyltransferase involved in cell wall biosynthesis
MHHAPLRVHYGGMAIPAPGEVCLGGGVKLQRLQSFIPEAGRGAEVLYLVSSALPRRWLATYWNARRDGSRVVWNQSAVSYPAVWPGVSCEDDNLLLEQGLHAADYVIYQSEFSRLVADRYLGAFSGPSEILYNAVDTRMFTPVAPAKRSPLTVLLAGTQYRLSSLEIALSALAALRRHIPDARLVVTGSMCWMPDRPAALQLARSRAAALDVADVVEFAGEYTQAQAPALFGRADVLIHTRFDDLCPNVVIEAMACGVPVVYSRSGGTPELVGDEAGVGVEAGHSWEHEPVADPERWVDAIVRVASNRAAYAEAARQRAVDRFDLQPWIRRHASIFEQVAASPQRQLPPRVPVARKLHAALQLVDCQPRAARQGERFNTQPDGRSALTMTAANATHATMLLLDDELQETSFSGPSQLSAPVPADLTHTAGTHTMRLVELLRASNEMGFEVAPLVSVIIPCYNQGRFLGEAIESVLRQSHQPTEVVVVNDGSSDDTASVAERYGVRCVQQANAGLAAARNRGIRESSGALLVFLDADDRLLPGALDAGVAGLREHADCAFVFGSYRHISADGSLLPMRHVPDEPGLYLTLLHYNHIGCPGAVIYRRSVFETVGGFDGAFNPAEDYELYLRIARIFPVRRHPHCVVEYRKYGASMSSDSGRMLRAIQRVLRAQRDHVASDKGRQRALADGLKGNREDYVELMRIQARDSRRLPLSRRTRLARDLLRWDPRGFVKAYAPQLYCALFRAGDAARNALIRLRASGPGSKGTIAATPNPIRTRTARWDGPASTSIAWETDGASGVEVHVEHPDGPLFSECSPAGSAATGEWVRDGMRFYLRAASGSGGESRRTLAVVTINIVPE